MSTYIHLDFCFVYLCAFEHGNIFVLDCQMTKTVLSQ